MTDPAPIDKCVDCGAPLNEGEAKTFIVCDGCWDKHYKKHAPINTDEYRMVFTDPSSAEGK